MILLSHNSPCLQHMLLCDAVNPGLIFCTLTVQELLSDLLQGCPYPLSFPEWLVSPAMNPQDTSVVCGFPPHSATPARELQ